MIAVGCMVVAGLVSGHKNIKKYPQLRAFAAWEAGHEKPALDAEAEAACCRERKGSAGSWRGRLPDRDSPGQPGVSLGFRAQCLDKPSDSKEKDTSELMAKLDLLQKGDLSRADLLELKSQTKRTSERYKRRLTFLSIDVANPTAMKQERTPAWRSATSSATRPWWTASSRRAPLQDRMDPGRGHDLLRDPPPCWRVEDHPSARPLQQRGQDDPVGFYPRGHQRRGAADPRPSPWRRWRTAPSTSRAT